MALDGMKEAGVDRVVIVPPWLSGQDKEWIMGRAICEWLGWPPPRAT
jgi:hypothetical protein